MQLDEDSPPHKRVRRGHNDERLPKSPKPTTPFALTNALRPSATRRRLPKKVAGTKLPGKQTESQTEWGHD
jgi:hypothetical protein